MKRKSVISLNVNLTSDGFKQGGLGAGVTNLNLDRWIAFNGNNPIVQTYWTAEHNNGSNAGSGRFDSDWVRSTSNALIGFFTTVKLD